MILAAATSELVPLGLRLPLWSALRFALTLAAPLFLILSVIFY